MHKGEVPAHREIKVGIIGGSGLYNLEGLEDVEALSMETPFGAPSDELVLGTLAGVGVAFIPRHGRGHRISPSELPSRANIWALKALGATHVISISAVGSLREEIAPRQVVIPDQLLDRTKGLRPSTFFGGGLVAHISFAEPYCPELSSIVAQAGREAGGTVHEGGTMVVMEGPQFSTKAESLFHRQIGGDLIGMTALPEAKLAREAEMCYCTIGMVTDYDCWREVADESVTVEMISANLQATVALSKRILELAIPRIALAEGACACNHALEGALMTDLSLVPPDKLEQIRLLVDKYL